MTTIKDRGILQDVTVVNIHGKVLITTEAAIHLHVRYQFEGLAGSAITFVFTLCHPDLLGSFSLELRGCIQSVIGISHGVVP